MLRPSLLILIIASFSFSSCQSDVDPIDFIKESVGRYSLQVTYIDRASGEELASFDGGAMEVSKINGKPVITLNPGRADILESTDFAIGPDGYYFNLETISNLWFDNINYVFINGENNYEYNGESYHGHYDAAAKSISFGFSIEYEDEEFSAFDSYGVMVGQFVD